MKIKIFELWKKFTKDQKRTFYLCSLSFFFCLGSYSFIRPLAQSLFLEHLGAKNNPIAWILTIFSLLVVIAFFNFLQKKAYVQKLHWIVTLISLVVFPISYFFMEQGAAWAAYTFYIWKEIYIMLFVGFTITYCNNYFTVDEAKLLYGPYGAIGAVGAIIGGTLTTYFSKSQNLGILLIIGVIAVIFSSFFFGKTGKTYISEDKKELDISPLAAVKDVKNYVFFMCLLIASTQFAINSANQIFDILLQENLPDKFERTAYLGKIYMTVNGGSLALQLLVMPWLLNVISPRIVQYLIPTFFLVGMSAMTGSLPLAVAGGLFIAFKSIDYSVFSVVKELLYFPLSSLQKYGAKYITDVFVYRSSKTVVAFLILKFSTRGEIFYILIASLVLWLIAVFFLDKSQRRLALQKEKGVS